MARSGMSSQQKVQILANELTRRLYNINKNEIQQQEYNDTINKMTQELKNSEYKYKTAREIIVSGIRGWRTRGIRRAQNKQEYYRPAHTTTRAREYKKLVARESWYKEDAGKENTQ